MNAPRLARGAALTMSLSLAACSSVNVVSDISDVQSGAAISGVPFRLAENYQLRVFRLQKDGEYKEVHSQRQYLPDQDRVFAASYKAWGLSDHEFKVELNDDNTLKSTSLLSKQKATDTVGAFADELVARSNAHEQGNAATRTESSAQRTAETTAVDLKGKAEVAQALLDATLAKADATELDRVSARTGVSLAQKKANVAAIEAGLPAPYP